MGGVKESTMYTIKEQQENKKHRGQTKAEEDTKRKKTNRYKVAFLIFWPCVLLACVVTELHGMGHGGVSGKKNLARKKLFV